VGELKFRIEPWSGLLVFNLAGTEEIDRAAPDAP
jgi:hypothetical protein